MYHFDVNWGESPDLATVNEAPLELYVGLPWGVKESDAPSVKSIVTDLLRAGSAGQLPVNLLALYLTLLKHYRIHIPLVRGLQVV